MTEYTKEVYRKKAGWYGYKILRDGTPVIVQDFKPSAEGFQPMSEEFANIMADALIAYYQLLDECKTPEEANRVAAEFRLPVEG